MLNPGNNFRFSSFFKLAAIGPNHEPTWYLRSSVMSINIKVNKVLDRYIYEEYYQNIQILLVNKDGNTIF